MPDTQGPTEDQIAIYRARELLWDFRRICRDFPRSRSMSLAVTKADEAELWFDHHFSEQGENGHG